MSEQIATFSKPKIFDHKTRTAINGQMPQAEPPPPTEALSPSSSSSEVKPKTIKERHFKVSWKINKPCFRYEGGSCLLRCAGITHTGTVPKKLDRIKDT